MRPLRCIVFKKEHTSKEIAQYVFDPDAAPLTLAVKTWHHALKWTCIVVNVLATVAAGGAFLWLSYPEYVERTGLEEFKKTSFLSIVELACVLFFTVDYVVRMFLTDKTKWKFIVEFSNIVDVLSIVPYYIQVVLSSSAVKTSVFHVFFIVRMIRVVRLSKYNSRMQLILTTVRNFYDMLLLFVLMVVLTLCITSTAIFFAERTRFDSVQQLWYRRCHPTVAVQGRNNQSLLVGPNCTEQLAPYQSIPEAFYWSVVTLTTNGHRSETPTSNLGKAMALLTSVLGIFFFAAPATVLATNYKIARQHLECKKKVRKFDQLATEAMKAQESLRKELETVWKLNDNERPVRFELKRELARVSSFEYLGVSRPIYRASGQDEDRAFLYLPLITLKRVSEAVGSPIHFTDDFNLHTAQRILTCYLVLDSDGARSEARRALCESGICGASHCDDFVGADPSCSIQLYHEFGHSYPELSAVVHMDQLDHFESNNTKMELPLRFVIDMPHVHAVSDVISLLRETRIHVSLGMRYNISVMHIPLPMINIMASRLIRELYSIAYERKSDECMIAYVHPNDAAFLLDGFCAQFIPTPSADVLIIAPELVDQQVLAVLRGSFPLVKMEWIPKEGANSYFRSSHIFVDSLRENFLLEVNLTELSRFDQLGFGNRFKIHVPVAEEERYDIDLQLE